jgi:hypothetical protein
MKKLILAFSGKKCSGKTTACEYCKKEIEKAGFSVDTINFADTLKEIVLDCFVANSNITVGDLSKEEYKNIKTDSQYTIRELLQHIGTDLFRSIDKNCWVNALKSKIDRSDADVILIGDLRFRNEFSFLREAGACMIRLTRQISSDNHSSETDLDSVAEYTAANGIPVLGVLNTLACDDSGAFDWLIDNEVFSEDGKNSSLFSILYNVFFSRFK